MAMNSQLPSTYVRLSVSPTFTAKPFASFESCAMVMNFELVDAVPCAVNTTVGTSEKGTANVMEYWPAAVWTTENPVPPSMPLG